MPFHYKLGNIPHKLHTQCRSNARLKLGDVVEMEIEGLGAIRNKLVDA